MNFVYIFLLFVSSKLFHLCFGDESNTNDMDENYEHGSHEEKAIDEYCHAWEHFSQTGDWEDSWDSIDYAKADKDHIVHSNAYQTKKEQQQLKERSFSPSNKYDTYNAEECRRVRKPWNALSTDERNLYIDGLLELRKQGQRKMELDDFIAVASVHDDFFGSITHHDSDYLFWHGYLVWELESRIRNLGGKWRCFGMPYWDFSDLSVDIFDTGLGGMGDPTDYNRVNDYSWHIPTLEFWTPDHNFVCSAKGDACPICSLKRDPDLCIQLNLMSAEYYGSQIVARSKFVDFQMWMTSQLGLPAAVDNSYDPIWYLFHSFESYLQAMWVNAHGYDEIDSIDLYKYPSAFSAYCDTTSPEETTEECVGINLTDELYVDGLLPKREWSYCHGNKLTIEKLYSLPQWNVIYDLNGDKFWIDSGLSEHVNGLNSEWFILPQSEEEEEEGDGVVFNAREVGMIQFGGVGAVYQMLALIGLICVVCLLSVFARERKGKKLLSDEDDHNNNFGYGTVEDCSVCSDIDDDKL